MLDLNTIKEGVPDYNSPMILVEAPGKEPRPCFDYRVYLHIWEKRKLRTNY